MSKDIKLDELPSPQDLSADQLPSPSDLGAAPEAPKPDVSQGESLIRGGVQGATMGFSDEALGALQAAASPVQVLSADDKLGKLQELYKQYRDIERAKNKAAEDANPKTYLAGSVGGGIATLPAAGTLKGAMGLGALAGYGASESDSAAGDMGNAALGAGVGAIGYGVGKIISKALSPSALSETAEQKAAKAFGANKGYYESDRAKLGKAILSSGAAKQGVTEDALNTLNKAKDKAFTEQMEPVLQQIKVGLADRSPEDVSAVVGDLGDKLLALKNSASSATRFMTSDVQQEMNDVILPGIENYATQAKKIGNDPFQLYDLKAQANQQANKIFRLQEKNQSIPPGYEEFAVKAKEIAKMIDDHLKGLANSVQPGLGGAVESADYSYGGLAGGAKALSKTLLGEDQGIKLSPVGDYTAHTAIHGNPGFPVIKDIVNNIATPSIKSAESMQGRADYLTDKLGKYAEKPATYLSNFANKALTAPKVQEDTQGLLTPRKNYNSVEDTKDNKPVAVSKDLYTRSDDDLKSIADMFSTEKGMEPYGSALNRALANKDIPAKNAALYVLATKPETRKLLIQRGLLAE